MDREVGAVEFLLGIEAQADARLEPAVDDRTAGERDRHADRGAGDLRGERHAAHAAERARAEDPRGDAAPRAADAVQRPHAEDVVDLQLVLRHGEQPREERTRDRAVRETNVLLTNLKESNSALENANHTLEHLNREKNEFMNIAAHDLKNPLCAISGHAQLLEIFSTGTPEQVLETAGVIRRQTQQMLDIISNLLDVRKIEEGCMVLKLVPCDARKVMEEVVGDYRHRAEKKDISLQLLGDCSARVQADLAAIRQILDNLVSNALKYSPPHTTVQCAVVTDQDSLCLQVIDEGPGLSEEDQQNLFRKFTRLTPVPTAGESSNGLGLWIVRRIANSMQGEIFCRSILGKGSCFELRLPLLQTP